jgi:ATP-binding cassette, subfamily B, bacterial MsbA
LISGLYFPSKGEILYIGESGKEFVSTIYRAKVGFVTQDIYFFQGSLRSNLTSGRSCTEEQIWATLEQVDAIDFVQSMGGLDVESSEAGRSLSGGQRRRLGLARVLLSRSDILIFDEVTAGLNEINKLAVMKVIERLSKAYIVVMISHEKLSLSHSASLSV